MFLLSLAKKAVQQDQDLRAILDATDKFSALGLKPERKKHSGRFILSAGSQSITLLEYRPRFVVQAASIRSELASLGLDMELPTPETSALSAEEHNAAQLFTGVARLDTRLWIRTRDKLRDPKIIAALNSAWSQLRTEPDELTKAKGLHEALCQPGLLKKDDTNRVVLAVCDPLGRRLGSIAPQVAGIQHLIQPGKKADPKNYGD